MKGAAVGDGDAEMLCLLAGFLRETTPPGQVIFLGLTAERMAEEMEAGTETGREYATAILRLSRDLLASRAARPSNTEGQRATP